jgi:hypothetical protein
MEMTITFKLTSTDTSSDPGRKQFSVNKITRRDVLKVVVRCVAPIELFLDDLWSAHESYDSCQNEILSLAAMDKIMDTSVLTLVKVFKNGFAWFLLMHIDGGNF